MLDNRESTPAGYFESRARLPDLSTAERRVMQLIARHKTSRQIADELFISIRTVDRHRANICEKLDLRGTNTLVKFAVEHRVELK